jgi:hypothetical protein
MHVLYLAKTEPHPFTSATGLMNGVLSYTADDPLFLAIGTTETMEWTCRKIAG